MAFLKFKTIKNYVTFLSVIVTLVVTLYAFIPKVLSAMSPIDKSQVEQMLRKHESFVSDGNIEGMLSVYHPSFSMDLIYDSGRVESFDKSQIAKHLETMMLIVSTSVEDITKQVSVVGDNQALVSIVMKQKTDLKEMPIVNNTLVYQSMLVTKYDGEPKILKVLSASFRE